MFIPNSVKGTKGRVATTSSAPSVTIGGIAFRGAKVCTTTTVAAGDNYVGGFRVNSVGRLVVKAAVASGYAAGYGRTGSGALCILNSAVGADVVYVSGLPVTNAGRLLVS